jgi:hypothetical protein
VAAPTDGQRLVASLSVAHVLACRLRQQFLDNCNDDFRGTLPVLRLQHHHSSLRVISRWRCFMLITTPRAVCLAGLAFAQRQDESLDSLMLSSSLQPVNDPIPRCVPDASNACQRSCSCTASITTDQRDPAAAGSCCNVPMVLDGPACLVPRQPVMSPWSLQMDSSALCCMLLTFQSLVRCSYWLYNLQPDTG